MMVRAHANRLNPRATRETPYRFLNLLLMLVMRDITTRYRRSILGPAWAILQPLILMVLFTMLRGFVDIPSEGVPYPIFSYAALLPWTFFSNAIVMAGPSVYANAAILKKIAMPREVFPVAAVVVALFDFCMAGIIMAGMMVYYRVSVSLALLWLPVLLFITTGLAFGVGMFVAALGSFKRDFIFATPFLMQFWLYATPIIYPLNAVPERWQVLYNLNPMVGIIEGFRSILIRNQSPNLASLALTVVVTGLVLAITWPLFRILSRYFADVM